MAAKRNVDSVALDRRALDEALAAWDITKWPGVTKRNQTQLSEAVASIANDAGGEGVGFVKRAVAGEKIRYRSAVAIAQVLGIEIHRLLAKGESFALGWWAMVEGARDLGLMALEFERTPHGAADHLSREAARPGFSALEATSSGRRFGRVGIGWRLRMNRGCARTDSDHHYALFHITPRDLGPLVPSDWWQDNRLPSPFPKDLWIPGRTNRPEDWLCPAATDVGENRVLLAIYPRLKPDPTGRWSAGPAPPHPEWLESFARQISQFRDQATISRLDFNILDRDPDDPRRGVCEP